MRRVLGIGVGLLALGLARLPAPAALDAVPRGALLRPGQATSRALDALRSQGGTSLALLLDESTESAGLRAASARAAERGLELYYWIEVGRSESAARRHPEWMASLQGHGGWRRRFPSAPKPGPEEVVKTYPWAPITSKEAWDGHRERIRTLLRAAPPAAGVYLNHLQAAPSACGCGNDLCRWTPDYGPVRTNTPMDADAAARFVEAVRRDSGVREAIPVWWTECEEAHTAPDGRCHGVPCYTGACWQAWTRQLAPLSDAAPRVATWLHADAGAGDTAPPLTAARAREVLALFQRMPPVRGGKEFPASRLVAVLDRRNHSQKEADALVEAVRGAGAAGVLLSEAALEDTWEPRLYDVRSRKLK